MELPKLISREDVQRCITMMSRHGFGEQNKILERIARGDEATITAFENMLAVFAQTNLEVAALAAAVMMPDPDKDESKTEPRRDLFEDLAAVIQRSMHPKPMGKPPNWLANPKAEGGKTTEQGAPKRRSTTYAVRFDPSFKIESDLELPQSLPGEFGKAEVDLKRLKSLGYTEKQRISVGDNGALIMTGFREDGELGISIAYAGAIPVFAREIAEPGQPVYIIVGSDKTVIDIKKSLEEAHAEIKSLFD